MRFRIQILAAALLFGTTGTAQALAHSGSAVSVGAARIVVGGGVLAAIGLARGELAGLRRSRALVALAAGGVAVYQLAFFAAVRSTGVAVGTVVAIGTAAVLTGALERLVEGTNAGRRWAVATGLAGSGVALLAVSSAGDAAVKPAGIALALLAAFGYASYAVLAKRLLRLGHSPGGVMGASFGGAGLLLLPVLAATQTAWLATPRGAALAVYLGLVPTALAYLLYGRGLRRISASETTTIVLVEPLTAAALGALVLHEHLTAPAAAGAALVLGGLLALAARRPQRRVRLPDAVPSET